LHFELREKAGTEKIHLHITKTWAEVLAFAKHKGLFQHIAKRTADRVLQVFRDRWLNDPAFVPEGPLHFRGLPFLEWHDIFVQAGRA